MQFKRATSFDPYAAEKRTIRLNTLIVSCVLAVYLVLTAFALGAPFRADIFLFVAPLLICNAGVWYVVSNSQKDVGNHQVPENMKLVPPDDVHLFGSAMDVERVAAIVSPKVGNKNGTPVEFKINWLSRKHGIVLIRALLPAFLIEVVCLAGLIGYFVSLISVKFNQQRLAYFAQHPLAVPFLIGIVMGSIAIATWWSQYLPWRYRFVVVTDTQIILLAALPWYLMSLIDTSVQRVDLFRIEDVFMSKSSANKFARLSSGTVGINVPGDMDDDFNHMEDVPFPERLQDIVEYGRTISLKHVSLNKPPYWG